MSIKVTLDILNQKGTPAFYSDVFANRPAAGYAGRVFISTDTGAIYEDTGSTWTLIADAGAGTTGTLQQVTTNGNTTTLGISVQGIGLNKGAGTGADNVVLSSNGLSSNTTGYGNTSLGNYALWKNTTGASNTAVGMEALESATQGVFNTVIGRDAGKYITTGSYNTIVGNNTLDSLTTGQYNTIIGCGLAGTIGNVSNTVILADGQGNVRFYDNNGNGGTSSRFRVGGTIMPTEFPNTQFFGGVITGLETHNYNIGVTGLALASSSDSTKWGVGVYGAGYTNGATRSAGVQGDGEVQNSSDTGSAIGVRGYATATHSGGLNIGILGEASGSSTGNYGLYTNMASAANTYAVYNLGTAPSYFGGNVGINTNAPLYQLDSAKDITYTDNITNGDAQFSVSGATTRTKKMILGYDTNSTNGFGYIKTGNQGVAYTPLYLNPSVGGTAGGVSIGYAPSAATPPTSGLLVQGNVGINTTSPLSQSVLTLKESASLSTAISLFNRNSTAQWDISVDAAAIDDKYFSIIDRNAGSVPLKIAQSTGVVLINIASESNTQFSSNATATNYVAIQGRTPNNTTATVIQASSVTSGSTSWYAFVAQSGNGSTVTTNTMFIYGNGNVVNQNNSYGAISDIKLKENIVDATPKLDDILKLKVRNFNFINDEAKSKQIGFVAQEIEEIFPTIIEETPDRDLDNNDLGTVTKSVKTTVLIPILVKAIQELNAKITSLEEQVLNLGTK